MRGARKEAKLGTAPASVLVVAAALSKGYGRGSRLKIRYHCR